MTELLTKREREALSKIRKKKWELLKQAFPPTPNGGIGIEAFMAGLNKRREYEVEEVGKYGVITKTIEVHERGLDARITFAKVGKAVIIGTTPPHYPKQKYSREGDRGRQADQGRW